MRDRFVKALFILSVSMIAVGSLDSSAWALDLQTDEAKLGYSVGYQVGGDFERQKIEIDPDLVVAGVVAALSRAEPKLTGEQMRAELRTLRETTDAGENDADSEGDSDSGDSDAGDPE